MKRASQISLLSAALLMATVASTAEAGHARGSLVELAYQVESSAERIGDRAERAIRYPDRRDRRLMARLYRLHDSARDFRRALKRFGPLDGITQQRLEALLHQRQQVRWAFARVHRPHLENRFCDVDLLITDLRRRFHRRVARHSGYGYERDPYASRSPRGRRGSWGFGYRYFR